MSLYEKIKEVCKQKGISINKLEKELGFARSSISKFDTNSPSIEKISLIADYLHVSVDYLLNRDVQNRKFEFDIFQELLAMSNWDYIEIVGCPIPGMNSWLDAKDKVKCDIGLNTESDCATCEHNPSYYYLTDGKKYYKLSESEFDDLSNCVRPYFNFRLNDLLSKKNSLSKKDFQEEESYYDDNINGDE